MQDLRAVADYLAVGMADGRAMPEPLREVGERRDGFSRERGKSPLHAHLQEIEAELAAFARLRRIAGRHSWAKEGGTLKEKLRRARRRRSEGRRCSAKTRELRVECRRRVTPLRLVAIAEDAVGRQ